MQATAVLLLIAAVVAAGDRLGETFTRPLGFQLGGMNLEEIRQRLGPATLQHSGDAGESEYVVCYVARKAGIQIAFKSGEMGGNDHQLLGFSMQKVGRAPSRECLALSPRQEASLTFAIGGLRLGIPPSAFRQTAGNVTERDGDRLVADFEYRDPIPPGEGLGPPRQGTASSYWDTFITLEGRFVENKLAEISVWRVVTQ